MERVIGPLIPTSPLLGGEKESKRAASFWRDASLRLRDGDTSVIPEYEDRGRLQDGTREQMQAAAVVARTLPEAGAAMSLVRDHSAEDGDVIDER